MLTEGLQVKKLAFLDVVFDGASSGKDDGFDADVLITTSELRKMLPDLLDALGGESVAKDVQVVQANDRTAGAAGADKTSAEPPPPHLGSHIDGPDPLYGQAVAIVHKHKKASISLVQRHLLIGYNRAARLIEDMEKAGIVSCMNSAGHRNILKTAGEVVA
jgi:recombination associated protein RdgC